MPDRPTARQRDAWLLAAMSVPAVALCAGIGWQWALLGGAISAALYLMQGRARQSGLALRDAANAVFGAAAGDVVMALAAIWNLFALAWLTQRADGAFPEAKDSVAVGLILLALAAFAAWKGEDVAARCAGVIALVLAGLYALLFCAAIGDVQLEWLRPWGGWRRSVLPEAADAVEFLAAHPGNLTLQRTRAALLYGQQPEAPRLLMTEGGLRLAG